MNACLSINALYTNSSVLSLCRTNIITSWRGAVGSNADIKSQKFAVSIEHVLGSDCVLLCEVLDKDKQGEVPANMFLFLISNFYLTILQS